MRTIAALLLSATIASANPIIFLSGPAPTPPAGGTTATDDFERADSGTLGANWTQDQASIAIASGDASLTASGSNLFGVAFRSSGTYSNDQYSVVEVVDSVGLTAGSSWEAGVRMSGTGGSFSGYFGSIAKNGDWAIYKTVSASDTTKTSGSTTIPADGDDIKLTVSGTTITMYINGVSIGSTTDSSLTSGRPGFNLFAINAGGAVQIESWSGGDGAGP